MRGKLNNLFLCLLNRGITPAGAGKTPRGAAMRLTAKDHPRRCGENDSRSTCPTASMGSPPQVRGKLYKAAEILGVERITPAGAGKTIAQSVYSGGVEDHPRRCGENPDGGRGQRQISGSPPQVRGKPHRAYEQAAQLGITPAGAGKTCRSPCARCCRWDHPRRCGENTVCTLHAMCSAGSPPQVRGKHEA